MAVRHRTSEQRLAPAHHAPDSILRVLSLLLGLVAVVALIVSAALFFGEMTISALTAAVICVAAGWARNRVAARAEHHD